MADTLFVSKSTNIVTAWAQAINDFLYKGRNPNFATTTGSANAQILTLPTSSLYASVVAGDRFSFVAGFTNTGPATIAIKTSNGTIATLSLVMNGSALIGGEIGAGSVYEVIVVGTNAFVLQTSPRLLYVSIREFGAVVDGSTDVTALIQSAINTLMSGSMIYGEATPGTFSSGPYSGIKEFYLTKTVPLLLPAKDGLVVSGAGPWSTRITQQTANISLLTSNTSWGAGANGLTVKDIWLESLGTTALTAAKYGLYLNANQQAQILNAQFASFNVGLRSVDSYLALVFGCTFDGGDYGIQDVAGNSGSNGWVVRDSIFVAQRVYGMDISSVPSAYTVEGSSFSACALGGLRFTKGNNLSLCNNYFEGNDDGASITQDARIGETDIVGGGRIVNNYFALPSSTLHYALKIGNLNGTTIENNVVASGTRYINFENETKNCRFGKLLLANGTVSGATPVVDPSSANVTYKGMFANFVYNGNVMEDYVTFPCDGQNYIIGDFPYGGWVLGGGTGTATYTRSPNTGSTPDSHNGRPVLRVNQTVGAQAVVAQNFTVSATVNARLRGHWATFLLDVYVNNASAQNFSMTIGGALSAGATSGLSGSTSTGWKTYSVCSYIDAAETSIQINFVGTSVAEYRIANPRFYVGLNQETMPGISGPLYFYGDTAAPTAGTWAVGDRVIRVPVAGQPKAWSCTVAGTPGTWVSEGSL